jgi:hypothetical protein
VLARKGWARSAALVRQHGHRDLSTLLDPGARSAAFFALR